MQQRGRLTAVEGHVLDLAVVAGHDVSCPIMDADDGPVVTCDHTHSINKKGSQSF